MKIKKVHVSAWTFLLFFLRCFFSRGLFSRCFLCCRFFSRSFFSCRLFGCRFSSSFSCESTFLFRNTFSPFKCFSECYALRFAVFRNFYIFLTDSDIRSPTTIKYFYFFVFREFFD